MAYLFSILLGLSISRLCASPASPRVGKKPFWEMTVADNFLAVLTVVPLMVSVILVLVSIPVELTFLACVTALAAFNPHKTDQITAYLIFVSIDSVLFFANKQMDLYLLFAAAIAVSIASCAIAKLVGHVQNRFDPFPKS